MNERVSIIIVSYNCRDALWDCLRKLMGNGGVPPIIVIDNASTDDSAEMVARDFPTVYLLQNTANRGFAAACNQGIRASASDFILLLDPDTFLKTADLSRLYDAIRLRPQIGVCGPRILNPDGTLQPSCYNFPTLGAMILEEFGLSRLFRRSRLFARHRMSWWRHNETREVEVLSSSCLLIRRTALEYTGLLDERFFLCFEEADLCWRLRQVGWQALFVSEAAVMHVGGQSSKIDRRNALGHRYQSLFAFYQKHYPHWQIPILRAAVQFSAFIRALTDQRQFWPIAKHVWKL